MTQANQSSEQANTTLPSSSISAKSQIAKKGKPEKSAYVKTTVRMLKDHDHAFRLASVLLERLGEPIHTMQAMVDEAFSRYTDFLQIKKGIDFQGIVPEKKTAIK